MEVCRLTKEWHGDTVEQIEREAIRERELACFGKGGCISVLILNGSSLDIGFTSVFLVFARYAG